MEKQSESKGPSQPKLFLFRSNGDNNSLMDNGEPSNSSNRQTLCSPDTPPHNQAFPDSLYREGQEQNQLREKDTNKQSYRHFKYCIPLKIEGNRYIEKRYLQIQKEITIFDEKSKEKAVAVPNSFLRQRKYINTLNSRAFNLQTFNTKYLHNNTMYLLDKYKTLEESNFKRNFLINVTGFIEDNLLDSTHKKLEYCDDKSINQFLINELEEKQTFPQYIHMCGIRRELPVYYKKHAILELIKNNQVVLISGGTGCGKTTQVPQFILDDAIMSGHGSTCRIICTQPRRISALSVAERVADERIEPIGAASVGYHIKLEKKLCRQYGSILFCTTGILLKYLQTDSALNDYSHIIIDEIHERDIVCDFALTVLKWILPVRPDIRIILMSATLNSDIFSKYYFDCPSLDIPGLTYPVEELYLEDIFTMNRFRYLPKSSKLRKVVQPDNSFLKFVIPYVNTLKISRNYPTEVLNWLEHPFSEEIDYELIYELIHYICLNTHFGAILVFLSGWSQITNLTSTLKFKGFGDSSRYIIIPLHSMLPNGSQKVVFESPPCGVRKIILSTNIAETSVTINDVVYVINNGRMKLKGYDVKNNIGTLKEEWVSLSNSRQRRGRAGRVCPGICYNLYTRGRESSFNCYVLPEINRTSLEQVILQAKILQVGMVAPFLEKVMNPPDVRALQVALKQLTEMNALDEKENLTPLGYHLANLPIGPSEGKLLILAAMFSCLSPIMTIVSSINFKDPFTMLTTMEYEFRNIKIKMDEGHQSDHILITRAMAKFLQAKELNKELEFCQKNCLDYSTMKTLHESKFQYAQYLCNLGFIKTPSYTDAEYNKNSSNVKLLKFILVAGLSPNIAISDTKFYTYIHKSTKFVTAEDGIVEIHPKSVNSKNSFYESPLLLYHYKLKTRAIFLHNTTMVYSFPVVLFAKHLESATNHDTNRIVYKLNSEVQFGCSSRTANLITHSRTILKWLIDYLMSHPEKTNDSSNPIIEKSIKFIVDLVTAETEPGVLDFDKRSK